MSDMPATPAASPAPAKPEAPARSTEQKPSDQQKPAAPPTSLKPAAQAPARPPFFRWIKISRKVDILTLITFAMSLAALLWQFVNYLNGPAVRLLPPDEIIIGGSDQVGFPYRDGGPYVHIVARMSYVNEGSAGYNATIKAERVQVFVADVLQFEQRWFRIVTTDASGPDGAKLIISKKSDPDPFGLAAGASESHLTLFQPWPKDCGPSEKACNTDANYVLWDDFAKKVQTGQMIKVRFFADMFGSSVPATAECTVNVIKQSYENLQHRRWDAPVCR